MNHPVLILCMKWGSRYGPEYVNRLKDGVAKHLPIPHRFICFTDDNSGLDPEVEIFPLPKLNLPEGSEDRRWQKLALFNKELFGLQGTALFLDLDVVVVADLKPLFTVEGDFLIIRDDNLFRRKPFRWLKPELNRFLATVGNSSVFRFCIGAHSYILDNYTADPVAAMRDYKISQQFQSAQLAQHGQLAYWPKSWCISFKNHCVPHATKSFFVDPTLPKTARIVVFAGDPKMADVIAGEGGKWYRKIGDIDWLKSAWQGEPDGKT